MRATALWRCLEAGAAGALMAAALGGAVTPAHASLDQAVAQAAMALPAAPLVAPLVAPAVPAAPDAAAETALEPLMAGLVLNGTLVAENLLVHREGSGRQARYWLPQQAAESWRMRTEGRAERVIEKRTHRHYCGGRDRCFYDADTALLNVTLQAADLLPWAIAPQPAATAAVTDPLASGALLNYDLSAWHMGNTGGAADSKGLGLAAQLEGRVYGPAGHGALRVDSLLAGRQSARSQVAAVWQVDRPQEALSLQAGSIGIPDTVFGAGLPVLGLRMGRNPRLQPLAQTNLRPQVLLPAAERSLRADVFVDGRYRQTSEVAYGPYSVEVQPTRPGRGEIDIVTTDATGQQTRTALPFYQSPQMLRPGVSDWSLDAGLLQSATGGPHWRGRGVFSGAMRHGLDRKNTVQLQALVADGARRVAAGVDHAHPEAGLTSFSLVGQRVAAMPHSQWWLGLGHELLTANTSFSVRLEQALMDPSPMAPGQMMADRLWRPRQRLALSVGADIQARWAWSAALNTQRDALDRRNTLAYLGLRWQTSANSQLALTVQRVDVGAVRSRQVMLTWSQALSPRWQGQTAWQHQSGAGSRLQWSAQSMPSAGEVAAQRTQIYGSVGPRADLGVRWTARDQAVDWRAEARLDSRSTQVAVGLAGALGTTGGRLFATRRIDDAFVLVDVGLPGLPVLLDNREVARTNAAGWAVVSEAQAHQPNVVGVDISALPIAYAMPTDQLRVVPASAAGVVARFDLSDGGIALKVRDAAGEPLPTGARAQVSSQRLTTAVTSRGEVFLDRSDRAADIVVRWPSGGCRFRFDPAAATAVQLCLAP